MILPSDNRYAWVAMYERDNATTPYAQVIVIGTQVRNRTQYTSAEYVRHQSNRSFRTGPNLQPKQVQVYFTNAGMDTARPGDVSATARQPATSRCWSPGAYLMIADDLATATATSRARATCNGYIYRIGNPQFQCRNDTIPGNCIPGNDVTFSQPARPTTPITSGRRIA